MVFGLRNWDNVPEDFGHRCAGAFRGERPIGEQVPLPIGMVFKGRSLFGRGIAQRHQFPAGLQHGVSMTEMLDAGAGG